MNDDRPVSAMVSYQSTDRAAAELLHEELSLRGFVVVHDQCTFTAGSRIADEMELGVDTCDAFLGYLTPESLYLGIDPDAPRPALTDEFLPAMDRRREPPSPGEGKHPVVVPIPKRLGPRQVATETVFTATGEDIGSIWVGSVRMDRPRLGMCEAAAIARDALSATIRHDQRVAREPVALAFVTRGTGQPPRFLTVDATSLVGGTRQPGRLRHWERILRGLRDVQDVLARMPGRNLDLAARAHISGAIALGRIFNQAGGWRPSVEGRYGPVQPSPMRSWDRLHVTVDPQGLGPDLSCEIALIPQPVFAMAREAIQSIPLRLSERVQLTLRQSGEIDSEASSQVAAEAAWKLRERIGIIRPPRTHIFCASPVEVAVLLGYRLTALGTDLHLYEADGDTYRLALVLPANLP